MDIEEQDAIHNWFELSYASYLVIPRSILQSADPEWQRNFVFLLRKLGQKYKCPEDDNTTYSVNLRDDDTGRFIKDPLCDYQRGRRYVEPNVKEHNNE
jgi:hypothetical protein